MTLMIAALGPDTAPAQRLLTGLALDLAAATSLWRPLVRFDTARRVTTRLPGPAGVEVWLGTWLPGQASDLHDHGSAVAALVVVEGALVERSPDDGDRLVRIETGQVAVLGPGALHSVSNDQPVPAVSIHVRTTTAARPASRG
jgi:mannose-6-phosphate isomerase-like protein (cupin superfamily)